MWRAYNGLGEEVATYLVKEQPIYIFSREASLQ
jgi:hypothetical protein